MERFHHLAGLGMTAGTLALFAAVHGDDHVPSRSEPRERHRSAENEQSHATLLEQIRAGSSQAFHTLVTTFYTPLTRFALTLLGDHDTADDVVQETLVRIWTQRESLRIQSTLRAYLYGAVRNRALNAIAHDAVVAQTTVLVRAENDHTSDPADGFATDVDALRHALSRLTERRQTALRLRYEEGLSYPEISKAMGISTASAEQLVFHAIRALRTALGVDR